MRMIASINFMRTHRVSKPRKVNNNFKKTKWFKVVGSEFLFSFCIPQFTSFAIHRSQKQKATSPHSTWGRWSLAAPIWKDCLQPSRRWRWGFLAFFFFWAASSSFPKTSNKINKNKPAITLNISPKGVRFIDSATQVWTRKKENTWKFYVCKTFIHLPV